MREGESIYTHTYNLDAQGYTVWDHSITTATWWWWWFGWLVGWLTGWIDRWMDGWLVAFDRLLDFVGWLHSTTNAIL